MIPDNEETLAIDVRPIIPVALCMARIANRLHYGLSVSCGRLRLLEMAGHGGSSSNKRMFILLDAHLKILTRFLAADDLSCLRGMAALF